MKCAELERIAIIETDLNINRERLEDLKSSMQRVRSFQYGDRVQTSRTDMVARSFEMMESIEDAIIKQSAELEEEKQKIIAKIRRLERPEYVELLYLRYVKREKVEDAAEKMNYGIRHFFKLQRRAKAEYEKLPE